MDPLIETLFLLMWAEFASEDALRPKRWLNEVETRRDCSPKNLMTKKRFCKRALKKYAFDLLLFDLRQQLFWHPGTSASQKV
jgi:hypothetical protein